MSSETLCMKGQLLFSFLRKINYYMAIFISYPISTRDTHIIKLSSAEFAKRVVKLLYWNRTSDTYFTVFSLYQLGIFKESLSLPPPLSLSLSLCVRFQKKKKKKKQCFTYISDLSLQFSFSAIFLKLCTFC